MEIRTKIMKSGAGWYLGSECFEEGNMFWHPYDRMSDYYYSKWEATSAFSNTMPELKYTLEEVIKEIEDEIKMVKDLLEKKDHHILIPKRAEFLNMALEYAKKNKRLKVRWNYSINATPENAIVEEK